MRVTFFAAGVVLMYGSFAPAQSLADLARKEEARRATAAPSKSYSDRDLVFDPASASARMLDKAPAEDRPKIAAAQFLAYYLRHTRAYAEYCRTNWGTELTQFVKAFSDAHAAEYTQAKKVATAAGLSEERVWSVNENILRQSVAHEMTSIPGVRGSLTACTGLNTLSDALAREFHFAKVFPDAHRILMATTTPSQ